MRKKIDDFHAKPSRGIFDRHIDSSANGATTIDYSLLILSIMYAGRLRFSDAVCLKWENYLEEEQRIKKVIRKTGRLHQFKIGQVAINILDK